MTTNRAWTVRELADEVGTTYARVADWSKRGIIPITVVPKIADRNAPRLYIPAEHIEDVLAMARITVHGIPGWGSRKEVLERYGVSVTTVYRWVWQGRIVRLETYGHPLYNIDVDTSVAAELAEKWKGFVKVHPRVQLPESGKSNRGARHRETFRPLSLSEGSEASEHVPATEPEPTPTPATSGRQCADSRCGRPGTDEIRDIGTFCEDHADEKRKILGIRRSA